MYMGLESIESHLVKIWSFFHKSQLFNRCLDLPVTCEDHPRSCAPVYLWEVVLDPVILLSPRSKVVLGAHYHEMDAAVSEAKPGLVVAAARHGEAKVVRETAFPTRVRVIEDPRTET